MFPAGYYYGGPLNEQIGPANAIVLQPELELTSYHDLRYLPEDSLCLAREYR